MPANLFAAPRAYNGGMPSTLPCSLRFPLKLATAALLAGLGGVSLAQAPAAEVQTAPAPAQGRPDQRIEKIRTEDSGARIDEVRVGGQTQSITVKPKANVPEYEIQPTDGVRARPTQREGAESGTGSRVWNMLKF